MQCDHLTSQGGRIVLGVSCPEPASTCAIVASPSLDFFPWGEALNPGPDDLDFDSVWFSFSNPSGLRSKEGHVIDLGPGIHACSETQLSYVTQPSCAQQFRLLAKEQSRMVRVHMGAPAPLRTRSEWAGSWTGVATISDFPSQEIMLPYASERSCGRVLTTRHFLGHLSVVHAVVYGFPPGPTWPQAKSLTSSMLEILTTELVLGLQGPRVIGGDFNLGTSDSPQFDVWRRLGWCSAQDLAFSLWGTVPSPTCKGQTERDLIWLSPEAISLCREVMLRDIFCDHSTIFVRLGISHSASLTRVWPLPSAIPWDQVDETWHSSNAQPLDFSLGPDKLWAAWACDWEQALDSYVPSQPAASLHPGQKGRLQRSVPLFRDCQVPCAKPSRPSEVQLRNDLIGSEVKKWFKQLRRLQSFVAAVRNMKSSVDAITYRLELWSSILNAAGFRGGFRHYWTSHRAVTLTDTPVRLPTAPPPYPVALSIFETFKACFESLENWHIRQRRRLLLAKYESNHAAIFHDLKSPQKPLLDLLVVEREYEVLAVDADSSQIHVSPSLDARGCSQWNIDDTPVQVLLDEDQTDLCAITHGEGIAVGSVLVQKQTLTATDDIHNDLLDYWKHTWCALPKIDDHIWTRVLGFFQAYVPNLAIKIPPLTLQVWRRGLKRFKRTAARGVDGISPQDLLALPDSWSHQLLELLNRIESGLDEWPTAILYGVVNLLAKDDDACTIPRFRPVVVFSVIYRAWASIRARQLLRQLQVVIDSDAYGFIPGCEPSQLWLLLQAEIECSLQQNNPMCGLSVDLVRAFNHIPRQHSFALAQHLGVPDSVLAPWKSFLGNCTRAFKIHDALSVATSSNCGMPEGDALSVYAMVQLNFVWHIYQKQFCPSVRACSFVDNLSPTALLPSDLAVGFSCLCSFFELWNLQIDLSKSYCWALSPEDRSSMSRFPMKLVYSATELGGCLSFCKRQHHGLQHLRYHRFAARWLRLERSMAPLHSKLRALFTVFWPGILHGANGTMVGTEFIDSLRIKALKHLKLNKAGTNAHLRLVLSGSSLADPGLWLLHSATFAFRRLVRKEPVLLQYWIHFHMGFDGSLFAGPCSQLLTLFTQIGWHVRPPFVDDHDGCSHNLLLLPDGVLTDLLTDAWLQYVARLVNSRKTMRSLGGLDSTLVFRLGRQLDARQLALVGALQSGTFCSSYSQSKFDCSKAADCQVCQVRDSQHHWLVCPRFAHLRADIDNWDHHKLTDSNEAFCGHLLPSRSPFAKQLKRIFLDISDTTGVFESIPDSAKNLQHIFTDGTSYTTKGRFFSCAAWGAINATTGDPIGRGHVPGLCQSSDRAELMAVLATLRYQAHFQISVSIWLDCKYVADRLLYLQEQLFLPGGWEHQDIWTDVLEHILTLGSLELLVKWAPSHLAANLLTDPLEDWFKHWNDKTDALAGGHNMARGTTFQRIFDAATQHAELSWQRLIRYRTFFFKVASDQKDAKDNSELQLTVQPVQEADFCEDQISLCMLYTSDVSDLIMEGVFQYKTYPPSFISSVLAWINSQCLSTQPVYSLTFIELTIALVFIGNLAFPFAVGESGMMETSALSSRFERPTFAYLLSCVRPMLLRLFRHFDWCDALFTKQAKVNLGIVMPVDGIQVRFPVSLVQRIRDLTINFFQRRPYRRCADLARPL